MSELTLDNIKEKVTEFFSPRSEAATPGGFTTEEYVPEGFTVEDDVPEGFTPEDLPGVQETIGKKIRQRFLGSDVDDPVEIPRLGAQISFAVAGGILGSRIPTLPGPAGFVINPVTGSMVGGMGGLMLGTFAPETALYLAAETGVIDQATREKLSLSPSELRTVAEGEMLLELATGGVLLGARTTGRVFGRTITGVGPKESELAEKAHGLGIPLTPVHVGNSTLGAGYVAVMGRFPWIGTRIVKRGMEAELAFQDVVKSLPGRLGPVSSWSDVSKEMYKDATNLVEGMSHIFNKKYEDVWRMADEVGAWVAPRKTIGVGEDILKEISQQTPAQVKGVGEAGPVTEMVRKFIQEEILTMKGTKATQTTDEIIATFYSRAERVEAPGVIAKQTLRQMDGLLTKIDEKLATLEPGARRYASSLFSRLKIAAQNDALINIYGDGAAEASQAMRALDKEFSETMASLFETSAAKRFGSVEKRGLRGLAFDPTTRIPIDQLASKVLMLDSPQVMEELHRIVTPDTFKRITAQIFTDAFENSITKSSDVSRKFDVEAFASHLGLDSLTSNRRLAIGKMLDLSGSPLTIKNLEDIVEVGRVLKDTEIPNVSKFLARGATIGGIRSLVNAVIPGLTIAGGTGIAFGASGLLGIATFIGGGKLVSAIISNPDSARALMQTLDKEATRLVRREAYVRALRFGINAMESETDIPVAGWLDTQQLTTLAGQAMEAFDKQVDLVFGK